MTFVYVCFVSMSSSMSGFLVQQQQHSYITDDITSKQKHALKVGELGGRGGDICVFA